jgi:hypothetical protein
VHGARADNDEEAVIALLDDLDGFFAASEDGGDGVLRGRDLGGEELRLDERVVAEDWGIIVSVLCYWCWAIKGVAYPSRRRRRRWC